MPLVRIDDVGTTGIIRDHFAVDLPNGAWTAGENARFLRGYAQKMQGYASALGTPGVAPYAIFYAPSIDTRFFAYFGLEHAYAVSGTSSTEISRYDSGGTLYTGTADDKWVGGILTGILVVTNGVDLPQYWVPGASNNADDLTNWPATDTCKFIRPFKNHMMAGNVTSSGTNYPALVRWSHPADPGALPTTWDVTDTTKDAGQVDLADTYGEVIDGGALNDTFIVWKQNATYALRYVGPPFIFSVQKVTEQSGILARNCWCETPLGLVVLTLGDVVLQTGDKAPTSIIDARNRKWLFDNLNASTFSRSFVAHSEDTSEVFVCFPAGTASWPNTALVWNYTVNTWGVRTIPSTSSAAVGYITSESQGIWSDFSSTAWQDTTLQWDSGSYSLATPYVVMSSPTNTKLYALDVSELANGSAQTSTFERQGLHFDAPDKVKLVRGVRPRIDGETGETVSVYVGGAMDADEEPTWAGPYTFTIGSTVKVDCLVYGRYISVKFSSTSLQPWRIKSYDVDVEVMGNY